MSQAAQQPAGRPFMAAASALRALPERLLHPYRRLRARRHLRTLGRPRAVLVVCLGNICRSAYAEAALRRIGGALRVESAGFLAPGRPSPPLARTVAAKRGLDLAAHLSRSVELVDVEPVDLILTMDARQAGMIRDMDRWDAEIVILGDLDPRPIHRRVIRDPYGHPEAVFRNVFDRIDRCLAELVALWGEAE